MGGGLGICSPRMEKQSGDLEVCAIVRREVGRARAQRPNSHAAAYKEPWGSHRGHQYPGSAAAKGSARAPKTVQGEGFARDQAQQPDIPGGRGGTGISSPTYTDTHSHRPTPGWLRVASARAQHPARRCGGHLPSARDRISDTVLRMVGIAAAAAGASLNQTLHLSRRRAGGESAFPEPSDQQPRGPCRPPRAAPRPGEALAHLRKEEETTKVSAEPSEICQQPRRGRLGEGRSSGPGAGAGGGIVGARAHSLRLRRGGEGGRGAG